LDSKKYLKDKLDHYINHLKSEILPFWLERGIDDEFGGFFTCFENTGKKLVSTDKYSWSQGRMVWIMSRLSSMNIFSNGEREYFNEIAGKGAEFLMENCLLENGSCAFILDREGRPKYPDGYGYYDISTFADCFVILGVSAYAISGRSSRALGFSKKLYGKVKETIDLGEFKAEPTPLPKGYRMHAVPMIQINTAFSLASAMEQFDDVEHSKVREDALRMRRSILESFVDEDDVLHEFIKDDDTFDNRTILGRMMNPGHILEDAWFMLEGMDRARDAQSITKVAAIARKALELGWDEKFGGLFQYADMDGGKPAGVTDGLSDEKTVKKIICDWDNKLWWPHSEALYTTLLMYIITGDEEFWRYHEKIHRYTFDTFPNPDRSIGEWIQIRDREGRPVDKIVALPVKDPFHIMRNLILLIELINESCEIF